MQLNLRLDTRELFLCKMSGRGIHSSIIDTDSITIIDISSRKNRHKTAPFSPR